MGVIAALVERLAMPEVTSLVVAVLCMLGQVTGMPRNTCNVDSSPHSEGICGDALLIARQNLCFLLYEDYPEHFSDSGRSKRSVTDLFAYPVDAFAKMQLLSHDKHEDDRREPANEAAMTPTAESKLYLPLLPKMKSTLPRPLPSAATRGRAASKRGPAYQEHLPHLQKRGMVCDCCFNKCRPSVLARYC